MPTKLPIQLNSRTFLRNIKPNSYPAGTQQGLDWEAYGDVYDNTDPRNPTYWGAPRPINGDINFGLRPGETPANAVRRLKMEGYVGLYSARAESMRKADERAAGANGTGRNGNGSTLERIAAAAALSRARNGGGGGRARQRVLSSAEANGIGKPSREELRDADRQDRRTAVLAGDEEGSGLSQVPSLAGQGLGNDPPDLTRDGGHLSEEDVNGGAGDETDEESEDETEQAEADDTGDGDDSDSAEEDLDVVPPVGGWRSPPPLEEGDKRAAEAKTQDMITDAARKLAGGGARRRRRANQEEGGQEPT